MKREPLPVVLLCEPCAHRHGFTAADGMGATFGDDPCYRCEKKRPLKEYRLRRGQVVNKTWPRGES